MGGFLGRSRAGSVVVRLGLATLFTMTGALGAIAFTGVAPADASGFTYYAYPDGGATTPVSCPQTTVVANQCTLTQALALDGASGTVALAVSGVESDPSTLYVGNFIVSSGSSLDSPVTIEPAAGVTNPILDGNDGESMDCPTSSCDGPVLSTPIGSFVDLDGVTVQDADNTTNAGGGGVLDGGNLSVSDSTFSSDAATNGGAISVGVGSGDVGSLVVMGSHFTNDSASDGGAIDVGDDLGTGSAVITSSTFSDDTAVLGGAVASGANQGSGTIAISLSTFSSNTASGDGGAVLNGEEGGTGTATIDSSSFVGNQVPLPSGVGGGAVANGVFEGKGNLSVSGSTFEANTAFDGGAIDTADANGHGSADITSSTFTDNSSYHGGGITNSFNSGVGSLTLTMSTLAGNTAVNDGGDLITANGSNTLAGDIIVQGGSVGACVIFDFPTDDGYNLNDDGTCNFSQSTSSNTASAVDAYLGAFGPHGGPTETIPLEASPTTPVGPDPALNTIPSSFDLPDGAAACSTADQRGVARDAPCDIGAYEVHPKNVATETTLVGSASSIEPGGSVTYTATVVPTADAVGAGVAFTQDGETAPCSSLSFNGQTATCTIAYPTPGTHQVTAAFGGDAVFAASSPSAPWTVHVEPGTTTTNLTSSATGIAPNQSVTLTATVTPTVGGPSPGSVTFDDDGNPLTCGTGSTPFDGTTATCVTGFSALPQHEVTAVYSGNSSTTGSTSSPLLITVAFANPGYRVAAADGGVFAFGPPFDGSMGGQPLNAPIVGMATDNATRGYWLVASDGGIFSFNAPFYGSMGGKPLNEPIVGMAATPDGHGYWLVASDGGIFAFGSAAFDGSMGGTLLNKPVVGMAPDSATGGYWEVASDGGIFSFDAPFEGSAGALPLNAPVTAMAATTDGGGYWLVGSDGGVFTYGDAAFHGSNADTSLATPIVGIAPDIFTGGYWLLAANGATHAYGAPDDGSFPDLGGASRAVAIAPGGLILG